MSTIYRQIGPFRLRSCRPYFRLPLTRQHKATILQQSQHRQQCCLWHSDKRVRIRRAIGQRQNLQFVQSRHTALISGVMVWGGNMVWRQISASFYS